MRSFCLQRREVWTWTRRRTRISTPAVTTDRARGPNRRVTSRHVASTLHLLPFYLKKQNERHKNAFPPVLSSDKVQVFVRELKGNSFVNNDGRFKQGENGKWNPQRMEVIITLVPDCFFPLHTTHTHTHTVKAVRFSSSWRSKFTHATHSLPSTRSLFKLNGCRCWQKLLYFSPRRVTWLSRDVFSVGCDIKGQDLGPGVKYSFTCTFADEPHAQVYSDYLIYCFPKHLRGLFFQFKKADPHPAPTAMSARVYVANRTFSFQVWWRTAVSDGVKQHLIFVCGRSEIFSLCLYRIHTAPVGRRCSCCTSGRPDIQSVFDSHDPVSRTSLNHALTWH